MTPILLDYEIGEVCYLVHEYENKPWLVTAVTIYPNNLQSYQLSSGTVISNHYSIELTRNIEDKLVKYE